MRRFSLTAAAGLAVLLVAVPGQANELTKDIQQAAQKVQRADDLLRAGNLERAGQIYAKALRKVPGFPEAHIGMGNIALLRERFEEALHHYEQARDGYARFSKMLSVFRDHRYTTAHKEITEIRDKIAVLQNPATSRGDAAYQISRMENEISRLQSVLPPNLEDEPEPPGEIYFFIGNALFRLGRYEQAIENWETCSRRYPRFALSYNNLAVAHWKLGQVEAAVGWLERAESLGLDINPELKADLLRAASDRGVASSDPGF